jgi:hypothetical protein
VDLSGLRLEWEPGVAVFGTVLGYAGGWPGARMVLFGADGELATALARSRVAQAVPLVADLPVRLRLGPPRWLAGQAGELRSRCGDGQAGDRE